MQGGPVEKKKKISDVSQFVFSQFVQLPPKEDLAVGSRSSNTSSQRGASGSAEPVDAGFVCHICNDHKPTFSKLQAHYGRLHYRQKLASHFL
jgi:hypothetical protein